LKHRELYRDAMLNETPASGTTAAPRDKHDGQLADRMDVRVWLRLLSCSTVLEKRLRRRLADRFGSTLPRFDVLAALERSVTGVTMGELSRALLVSNGNVTSIVKQLEKDGYVTTRPAAEDKRSLVVALTPVGRSHFSEMALAHHDWIHSAFAEIGKSDMADLFALLGTLRISIASDGDA
jgi:DNA-binding MarR family transcriptional regulator